MIHNAIAQLPICADVLNPVFENIQTEVWRNDYALMAYARTLLYERVGENHVSFVFANNETKPEDCCKDDTVLFWPVHNVTDSVNPIYKNVEKEAKKAGYEYNKKLEIYFKNQEFHYAMWQNPARKSTIVLFDSQLSIFHNTLSAFYHYVPWFFAEKPLQKSDTVLMGTFAQENIGEEEFKRLVNEFYEAHNFRDAILEASLKNVERVYLEREKKREDELIKINQKTIDEYQALINERIAEIRKSEIRRLGLEAAAANPKENRILAMFKRYKGLYLDDVENDSIIKYFVRTKLTNVNIGKYRGVVNNPRAGIYCAIGEERELVRKVLDSIFEEQRFSVYAFGAFQMDLRGGMSPLSHVDSDVIRAIAIPNPHVYYYACSGSFAAMFNEEMRYGNFAEAINVTISETANINFPDGAAKSFVKDFFGAYKNVPCVEDRDGNTMTPSQVIEIIRKEMEE